MSQSFLYDILVVIDYEQATPEGNFDNSIRNLQYNCRYKSFEKAVLDAAYQVDIIEKGGGDILIVKLEFVYALEITE
jgi:hypothetical protein